MDAPRYYYLDGRSETPLVLTDDMVYDIPLPVKRVDVHVQDPSGAPVSDVKLTTNYVSNFAQSCCQRGPRPSDSIPVEAGKCLLRPIRSPQNLQSHQRRGL